MDEKKAGVVLKHIEMMPSLSPTVGKILQVANDPTSSANDLNKVISLDPVLAAKVLKLVNSAYFGFSEKVTSTVRAIVMLGLTTIKNLALSTAATEAISSGSAGGINMDEYWKHLLATGVCAKLIARKVGVHKNFLEDYFLSGMLHDIGKVVINRMNPAGYVKIITAATQTGKPLHLYETAIFGINHAEIGEILGRKWGLQAQLIETMAYHHDPSKSSEEHRKLVDVISISNCYAKKLKIGNAGSSFIEYISDDAWMDIGLTESALEEIEGILTEGVERAQVFLQTSGK